MKYLKQQLKNFLDSFKLRKNYLFSVITDSLYIVTTFFLYWLLLIFVAKKSQATKGIESIKIFSPITSQQQMIEMLDLLISKTFVSDMVVIKEMMMQILIE